MTPIDIENIPKYLISSLLLSENQNRYFLPRSDLHAPLSFRYARHSLGLPRKYDGGRVPSFSS